MFWFPLCARYDIAAADDAAAVFNARTACSNTILSFLLDTEVLLKKNLKSFEYIQCQERARVILGRWREGEGL